MNMCKNTLDIHTDNLAFPLPEGMCFQVNKDTPPKAQNQSQISLETKRRQNE
jgi:hypothetical protein